MLNMFRNWVNQRFSDPQIIILWVLLISGFLIIVYLGDMLTPVFAGLIIAYLLEGVVATLQKIKIPRKISVLFAFLIFIFCALLLLVGLLPLISRQIGQLFTDLPSMITNVQKELLLLPDRYPEFVSETQINNMIGFIKSELTRIGQAVLFFSVASLKSLITILVYFVLVPFLVLFFLKDKLLILNWIKSFLPNNRDLANEVWNEVNQQISNYIRGKIWEILIVWSGSYVTFTILKMDYAMLISLFIGLSVLIPYIGATVMTLPVVLIAFFQWGIGPEFTKAVIAYAIIQVIDGNILVPLLLSEVVNLHPVAIIVSLLIFGGLWGIWGLFFAIPLATLVHAVIKTWFTKKVIHTHSTESDVPPAKEI